MIGEKISGYDDNGALKSVREKWRYFCRSTVRVPVYMNLQQTALFHSQYFVTK